MAASSRCHLLVLLAGAGVAWFVTHRHTPTQVAERQLTANPPEDYVTGAAISPDGKHIAYHDLTGLYLRSIDSGETHAVSVPAEVQTRIWGVEWFPNGGKLVADAMSPEGSEAGVITILGQAAPLLLYRHGGSPAISPDGQSVAFVGYDMTGKFLQEVWVGAGLSVRPEAERRKRLRFLLARPGPGQGRAAREDTSGHLRILFWLGPLTRWFTLGPRSRRGQV